MNYKKIIEHYQRRLQGNPNSSFSWKRPNSHHQMAVFLRNIAHAFNTINIDDLDNHYILDIGCGNGNLLNNLITWGANKRKLYGTEVSPCMRQRASDNLPAEVKVLQPDLAKINQKFSIIFINTVLSSITDKDDRKKLLNDAERLLAQNGILVIFDMRYENPWNNNTCKVSLKEILRTLAHLEYVYRKRLILLPMISRVLARYKLFFLIELISFLFPILNTNHLIMFKRNTRATGKVP